MKKLFFILCIITLTCAMPCLCAAQDAAQPPDLTAQWNALPTDELAREIPPDIRDLLRQNGLEDWVGSDISIQTPNKILQMGAQIIKNEAQKPIAAFCAIAAVVLLTAFLEGVKETATSNSSLSSVFQTVSTLGVCACVAMPIIGCIEATAAAIRDCSNFILSFIPVFSGVLTAGGQPLTGATYSVFLFWVCQIIAQVAATTLVPLMGIYLAMSVVGAAVPSFNIGGVAGGIKSLVSWALGLMLTLFVGLLTIQSLVSAGGDAVTVKTTKFLIGSFVPVVGSALSEAFTAAQGYIGLLKATLGAYGMVVAFSIFLPTLLRVILWYLAVNAANLLCDVFGLSSINGVLKSIASTLGILLAIILSFILLLIISTSLILVVGKVG